MTGDELKAARKKANLTQCQLAQKAEVSRDTVQYWEGKPIVVVTGWGPQRLIDALGLRDYWTPKRARAAWGLSYRDPMQAWFDRRIETEMARIQARQDKANAVRRVICGAKTRKGRPCRMKSEPGKRRCKFHGGMSTGPRTQDGRQRIADAQRRRWKIWREQQSPENPDPSALVLGALVKPKSSMKPASVPE